MDKSRSNSKQKVETKQVDLDTGMPDLPKKELFAITFAFLGINMAFSLQSSQMSRICQTIGANPNNLGFFFIFPPLMGMIVQPIMGKMSDRTWNRFGRRLPYLLFGTPIAALVLIMLPFSGSLGFGYVVPGRLELPTSTLSVWRSNQLSYRTGLNSVRSTGSLGGA